MNVSHPCRICGGPTVMEHHSSAIEVWRCDGCGHREALHAKTNTATDYYENTPTRPRFIESLKTTRERQARDTLRRMRRLSAEDIPWLDFGCGRGWFLQQARSEGRRRLAGFDASELSLGWLKQEGFAAARPLPNGGFWPDWSSLPEQPGILSLFDVLEHFEDPSATLDRLLRELPSLRWLVVKVPISEGGLFRIARVAKARTPSAYEQLFQTGTLPPHFHYFCVPSFERLLTSLPLQVAERWSDRDVDDLFGRMGSLDRLPGGTLAGRLVGLLPGDTSTWLLRVKA